MLFFFILVLPVLGLFVCYPSARSCLLFLYDLDMIMGRLACLYELGGSLGWQTSAVHGCSRQGGTVDLQGMFVHYHYTMAGRVERNYRDSVGFSVTERTCKDLPAFLHCSTII